MKVLVDGAAGFLGRHVVASLSARGVAVRATDAAPPETEVERDRRDLRLDPLADLFDGITHVVHVAGLFDLSAPREALARANVALTRRMARAAALAGVERFVHVSSASVYGRPARSPVREDAPLRPGNRYERSKAAGERALTELALPWVVLRPSGIYGPHGRYGLAAAIAAMALGKERGTYRALRSEARMSHVHVEDVAEAAVHLLGAEGAVHRAFNVAGRPIGWGLLMEHLERCVGVDALAPVRLSRGAARALALVAPLTASRTRRTNEALARRWRELCDARGLVPALAPRIDPSAYAYWSADHVYAADALLETGFRLRHPDPREGLRETVGWYRAHRWLP